jgi:hypothetical protein
MDTERLWRWARHGASRIMRVTERWLPDRVIHRRTFERNFGRPLDLREPRTFNEKLYWLMLYYRRPILTRLADKYEVRSYVAARIGEQYLNELYGVWDDPEAIPIERLPPTFVLKVTSGWQMNVFCHDRERFDEGAARQQLREWLHQRHFEVAREWAYKNIRARVIAERLLVDTRWGTPPDYKLFCFNGEPQFIQVDTDRFAGHRRDCFDLAWRPAPFTFNGDLYPPSGVAIPRPANLEEMIACARQLSAGFPFLRTDFFAVDGKTVFGELTWYPEAGRGKFVPDSYDEYWGRMLKLPQH